MIDQTLLLDLTESYLKSLICEVSNSLTLAFDSFTPFGELGIDSFRVLKIIKHLEVDFGTLPKTLLFENFNVNDLVHYFVKKHNQTLCIKFANELQSAHSSSHAEPQLKVIEPSQEAKVKPIQFNSVAKHITAAFQQTPILILEEHVFSHPELGGLVESIFSRYKNEGSVSRGTRNIAPNLFIGSDRRGYLNYSRSKNIILVYAYTGPKDYMSTIAEEMYQHCIKNNFQLNFFTDKIIESIGDIAFSSTPFGALQRVLNLREFTLEGGAMRRLRYQVSKFEKSGNCKTEEYKCGSNPNTDQDIANIIDQWCDSKTMVNPLIYIVRDEILAGTLRAEHRLFLTYIDNVLQNVILLSQMSPEENGYLMDLEFYHEAMPLGGLEFAIVKIIEALVAEGSNMLSLGGTYGCKLVSSANADPEIDKILDDLRRQNIFNDEGNLQFKNKFRPENRPIFLCRPVGNGDPNNVIDIIMMVADPARMQTSDAEFHNATDAKKSVFEQQIIQKKEIDHPDHVAPEHVGRESKFGSYGAVIEEEKRAIILADFGFNPLNIPNQKIDFDLKTDSWAQLEMPAIEKHMAHLHAQLQQTINLNETIRGVFPFAYFVLTASGRTAEHIFCKAWIKKGVVLQNLLFPTCIFHQIDKGFTPRELPHSDVFQLDSKEIYKGNLDWQMLKDEVVKDPSAIAFVCIELNNNATGGHPVSLAHLYKVKDLLTKYSIPLVIDGTRVLENAQFLIEHEKGQAGKTIWAVAQEIFSCADAVIGSLAKDFCVNKGGVIATNDEALFHKLQDLAQAESVNLDIFDKKLVALSLQNQKQIEIQILRRMEGVRTVWQALKNHNIPVVAPVGGHCVLINIAQIPEFKKFEHPVASFLAWLYLNTGIRAGAHSVGMQKDTAINDLVRLAIPVGLKRDQIDSIIEKLIQLFASKVNIPEVIIEGSATESLGDVYVNFTLKAYHNVAGNLITKKDSPSDLNTSEKNTIPAESIFDSATQSTKIYSSAEATVNEAYASTSIANTNESESNKASVFEKSYQPQDIAIVGMAGRYPKAKNLSEMWENLIDGRDCVEEIPNSRYARRHHFETTEKYRGGFMDDIDKFDSLFFNISPREAEMLDPQERLFLEVAWEAIEDAGYYPEILVQENEPRNIGVFVGAVWAMYQVLGVEEKHAGNKINPNSFLWSIANRVSYWMNFSGPSLTLDTACSSSLTAVYLACEAINRGDCSAAIVGGVNLDLHQSKFNINSAGGALSKDGVCRSFGRDANGYVAGEGIGAIFLKPLERAIQDKDNIHGVIKSVVVNHGGRNSGYAVPNPKAQASLILSALNKASIDARTIGYIEAHGTGTELGDPIEISGLNNAFEGFKVENQTCAIGSIKTNIGHLEAAAGVVGVCKVLLQMKHRQLVPSLHSAELNEFIDFKNSPFYVEQNVEEWKAKVVDGVEYPLRAGVSSFGAGGSNAHVILEKYELPAEAVEQLGEKIFPLSARNEDQLHEAAVRLRNYIQQDLSQRTLTTQQNITDIAYTLQFGRKSFEHRLAIVASTKEELVEKLNRFINAEKDEKILIGHLKNSEEIIKSLNHKEKEEFIQLLSQRRDPNKLASLWTDGLLSDWQGFLAQRSGRKISLPTYPFADKRHWACEAPKTSNISLRQAGAVGNIGLHPLIDTNESTFERQLFKKIFHDKEFFIYDHLVSEIPTLPGVAYLELARKAGELATGRKVQKIKNILWVSPLTVVNSVPTEVFIDLKPNGDIVQFEVFSQGENGKKQLYSQGKLAYATQQELDAEPEYIDIKSIRARCSKVIDGKDAYPLFKSLGLNLGPSFQVLQEVFRSENEVLGALKIPEFRSGDFYDFILHPSLVDGAFQAGMGAGIKDELGEMFVPYSIGEVEVLFPLTQNCFSYVTKVKDEKKANSKLSKANVCIVDEDGKILVKMRESIGVPLTDVHEKPAKNVDKDGFSKLYYSNVWENISIPIDKIQLNTNDSILLFDTNENLQNLYQNRLNNLVSNTQNVILVQPGDLYQDLGKNSYRINPKNPLDFMSLLDSLNQKKLIIGRICFAWSGIHFRLEDIFHEESLQEMSLREDKILKDFLENGVYSFLNLCQALIKQNLKSKIQLLYLYLAKKDEPQPHNEAMNGFLRSLQLENSKLVCKTLEIRQEKVSYEQMLDAVLAEFDSATQDAMVVRYDEQQRYVRTLKEFDLAADSNISSQGIGIKEKGVYLITGGAGGLGLIFAEFLAKECKAKLVLTGRSKLSVDQQAKMEEFRNLGAEVLYMAADVSNFEDIRNVVSEAKSQFGEINGIIHSAGVIRDSYLRNKTVEEMNAVFAPKLFGTIYLDQVTRSENLDFFVMFSSLSAIGGNAGQCDYAFANHYMDSFAAKRELRQSSGERSGKTLSLNWSLWAEGGMRIDEQTELFFKKNLGIKPITKETGLEAFLSGLTSKKSQFVVLEGEQDKIERVWGLKKDATPIVATTENVQVVEAEPASSTTAVTHQSDAALITAIQNELSQSVMRFLKLDANDIDVDKILLDLGFDSIGLTTYANAINEKYTLDVTPVLFFEYPSIREIAKYLSVDHKIEVQRVHQPSAVNSQSRSAPSATQPIARATAAESSQETIFGINKGWNPADLNRSTFNSTSGESFSLDQRFASKPIAIVGMSGVMPQSDNLEEFWENLKDAKNLVTVIPKDRWIWEDYDGDPLKEVNKTNSKWGGFMKEIDKFDPLFFGISPREAEMMDPQQRIFLETVWKTVEDSGQKVSDLSGTKTGLFIGVATRDYTDLMNWEQVELDGYSASGNSHSILVNRVSFLLNLRGPSAPIDTACSSSLVALHRAIESIHTGSSDMAIVGGVQVMLTPAGYISFGMAGMLSSDGKCKSFDKGANGYVRGEGSGAIFLKPLAMAQADGNHVYAVIKSTSENHGGKVTALTAPNPNAQAELLVEAYEKANIDPATVGYIECHGTGTSLGDPIEIQALKKSFNELYKRHNKAPTEIPHCGLSSVKTNIGHLETAAGIAGIFKVLLAIKHRQIPANIHFDEINPYINLKGTPFYIVDKTTPWEAIKGDDDKFIPRRAGVSSFGFGGANAHIVLEEYLVPENQLPIQFDGPYLIVLSAKNEDRLKAYAQLMLDHALKHEINLSDFAYTLQVGRDAMTVRLGFTVNSVDQLLEKLRAFVGGEQNIENVYQGKVTRNSKEGLNIIGPEDGDESQESNIEKWFANKTFSKLLAGWTKGLDLNWNSLYTNVKPKRLSLPTYPFARERYWFSTTHNRQSKAAATTVLHPLLHRNTSVLNEQSYSSTFNGKEFFLSDHRIQGKKVLPVVAYLEMIRAALSHASPPVQEAYVLELKSTIWTQPFVVTENRQATIALFENDYGQIDYEIYSAEIDADGHRQEMIHCHGNAAVDVSSTSTKLDIQQLQGQMGLGELAPQNLYSAFSKIGMEFGDSLKAITTIYRGEDQYLVKLNMPAAMENQLNYFLHPSLMDSVLHAAMGLVTNLNHLPLQPPIPFALETLKIVSPCTTEMYAWVRYSRGSKAEEKTLKLDIDLTDSQGEICVAFKSLAFNNDKLALGNKTQRNDFELLLNSINNLDMHASHRDDTEKNSNVFGEILDNIY